MSTTGSNDNTAPAGLSAGGGDWPEDAAHENGNYMCMCSHCGAQFIGHKRRVTCKTCAGLSAGGGAGWQPIETAPKDRVVDLWSTKGFRYPDALWDVCCGEECWTDPNDHGSIEEGGPYTHWRYPPEPPAEGGA